MKTSFAFKTAAMVGLTLALGGCMGVDSSRDNRDAELNANKLKFVQETSYSAARLAGVELSKTAGSAQSANDIDALGCPKLSKLVTDMQTFQGTAEKPLPASFIDYLSCFGIEGNGTLDDIDIITDKLKNPAELLDCICGGSALSDLLKGNLIAWTVFDGSVKAATSSFDGSTKGATSSFDGSSDGSTGSFDGSTKGTTGAFGD